MTTTDLSLTPHCPGEVRVVLMMRTLRQTNLFRELSSSALENIVRGCRIQSVKKGSYLFHEGEPVLGFFAVHSGAINVHRVTEDGREQVIRVFYPGECFAEAVLVGNHCYPASAKAAEDAQVVFVPGAFFRDEIRRDPDLALNILGSMSQHLRFLVETVEGLKLRQAESRIVRWMLEQIQTRQNGNGEQAELQLPLPKHLLASQLGTTSETLSRVFARLRKLKLLTVEGKRIHFHSISGLREFLREIEQQTL